MRIAVLLAALCYWLLLTVLLLVPNPAALIGLHGVPMLPWGKFGIHLLGFTGLGFLAHATRWPKRPCWPLIVFLVVYGIATESLQLLIPPRTAQVADGIENMLGIVVGSLVYWLVLRLAQPYLKLNLAAGLVRRAEAEAAGE
jgi:hypothetical protein